MKKMITLLTMVTTSLLLSGQSKLTLLTGVHNSNTQTNGGAADILNKQAIHSGVVGLSYERMLDKRFSIETGASFLQKGFSLDLTQNVNLLGIDLPLGASAVTRISYLEFPVRMKYNFGTNSNIKPYLGVGPSLSYALNGKLQTRVHAGILDFNATSTDLELSSTDYNRAQINGQAVAGIDILYGIGSFRLQADYAHSFTDLISDDFILDTGGKHHGWSLSAGYTVHF